jgi:hypothetical protein
MVLCSKCSGMAELDSKEVVGVFEDDLINCKENNEDYNCNQSNEDENCNQNNEDEHCNQNNED